MRDRCPPQPARPKDSQSKHVALAFFGLTRSLKYTLESIERNIFDVLTDSGHTFDILLHTYAPAMILLSSASVHTVSGTTVESVL